MRAQLDDPLDAIAVHAWNGTWGVLAVGLFANKNLVFNAYGPTLGPPAPATQPTSATLAPGEAPQAHSMMQQLY